MILTRSINVFLLPIVGASFHWRVAIGLFMVAPVLSLILMLFSPESPSWLISKGKIEKAEKSLTYLRNNSDIELEFKALVDHLSLKEETAKSFIEQFNDKIHLLKCKSFYKPFFTLLPLFTIGMSWSGLITIGNPYTILPRLMRHPSLD